MPSFRLLAPALFALALCTTPPVASAQTFSDTQRGDIEVIVKNYLVTHPGVPTAKRVFARVASSRAVLLSPRR